MAEALLDAGASVLAVGLGPPPTGELDLTRERLAYLEADIANDATPELVVSTCLDRFGHLEMLVNNAGLGPRWAATGSRSVSDTGVPLAELDKVTFSRFFAVHVLGPLALIQHVAPLMVEQGFGRIVAVTTSLSTMIRPMGAPYGPTKAAHEALTSTIAHELDGTGVTVNVLVPGGSSDTRMVTNGRTRSELIRPEVMGPPIRWLASRDADGVTARRIIANLWDPTLPLEQALARAVAPIAWPIDHRPLGHSQA